MKLSPIAAPTRATPIVARVAPVAAPTRATTAPTAAPTRRCHGCRKPHVGDLLPSGWRAHRTVRGIVFCAACAVFNVGSWQ